MKNNIEILQGDLTSMNLDIIVNAANHTLLGGGGIDDITHRKAVIQLLEEYYKLFPNDGLFPEWDNIPVEDKVKMLEEAIKDKKDLSQTKLFKKYEEGIKDSE